MSQETCHLKYCGGFGRGASRRSGMRAQNPQASGWRISVRLFAPRPAIALTTLRAARLTHIYVCTTCRSAGQPLEPREERAGFRLFEAIAAEAPAGFTLEAVECLSVCKRPCTVSFAAPGKWTYVYGDLAPETAAATILEGARLYAEAADGLIPWRERPDALKKGVVARIPPLSTEPRA